MELALLEYVMIFHEPVIHRLDLFGLWKTLIWLPTEIIEDQLKKVSQHLLDKRKMRTSIANVGPRLQNMPNREFSAPPRFGVY